MNNSFNERVNVLTELLNEGHLTNDEYLDLIESLRGGPLNEKASGSVNEDSVNGLSSFDAEYQREVENPNKLGDYERFLHGDMSLGYEDGGDAFTAGSIDNIAKEYIDFIESCKKAKPGHVIPVSEDFFHSYKNPLHNTFYHEISKKEVEESAKHYQDMVGLYKQDMHSGNIIRGCEVKVDNGGRIECVEPFHSYEYNTIPVKDHPAYEDIMKALKDGRIVLS